MQNQKRNINEAFLFYFIIGKIKEAEGLHISYQNYLKLRFDHLISYEVLFSKDKFHRVLL